MMDSIKSLIALIIGVGSAYIGMDILETPLFIWWSGALGALFVAAILFE